MRLCFVVPRTVFGVHTYWRSCAILVRMDKTMLIAGKTMPDAGGFAEGVAYSGRNIVVTGIPADLTDQPKRLTAAERKANLEAYEEQKSREAKSGICTIEWNRSSPLSARSLVLQTLTIYGGLDEVLLYFDEEWFASRADKMDSEQVSRGCDEMIAAFQYLALEAISTFRRRETDEGAGTLIFLYKQTPSRVDVLRSPGLMDGMSPIASPLVAAASAAFVSFAENLCAVCQASIFVDVVLLRGEGSIEGFRRDDETGRWVCTYLASRTSSTSSKQVRWARPIKTSPASLPPEPVVTVSAKKPKGGLLRFFKR